MFQNKRILITGITGSWGHELLSQLLLLNPKEIVGLSRNEFNIVSTKRKFNNPKLKFLMGDVRDYEAVLQACEGVDILFHLSATKHVSICEEQPEEAVKTNIFGTQNIIKASLSQQVSKVIDVSTDKACAPNNLYGMTKAVGEKLILNANKHRKTEFICIRAGNVLGSAGSAVPLFIDQIKKNNQMTLTDGLMTRYFMSLPEAIGLLLKASEAPAGSLLVMKMPSCSIGNLAETLGYLYGDEITTIRTIGAGPGEKKHEMLVSENESPNTYIYDDNYYIISEQKLYLPKAKFVSYSSNSQPLMNKQEIIDMLKKGGFCG